MISALSVRRLPKWTTQDQKAEVSQLMQLMKLDASCFGDMFLENWKTVRYAKPSLGWKGWSKRNC